MAWLDIVSEIIAIHVSSLFAMFAVFARLSLFVYLMPGIGEEGLPARIRLMVTLILCGTLLPLLWPQISASALTVKAGMILIIQEAIIGAAMGLSLRMFIFVLQILGNVVSQTLSISQVLGEGITSEPNTTISTLFMLSGVALFFAMDLHLEAIALLVDSYDVLPLGNAPNIDRMAFELTQLARFVFRFSFSLAMGFLILNFLYNVLLGFVNRAMPQLMVTFVGMPLITWVGLVLLTFSIIPIMTIWTQTTSEYIRAFSGW